MFKLCTYAGLVTYWPSTKPSTKRCTCVNKRKNSGSRWTLNNITSTQTARVIWGEDAELRNSGRQDFGPSVTHAWATKPRWEAVLWSKEELWVKISLFPSPAHLTHTANINPFENKVWEIYFYKEVCAFVHWRSYIMFDYFPHLLCMWL